MLINVIREFSTKIGNAMDKRSRKESLFFTAFAFLQYRRSKKKNQD